MARGWDRNASLTSRMSFCSRRSYPPESTFIWLGFRHLAEFLASAEAHEVVLTQRLQDTEAQDVLAQMGGYQGALHKEHLSDAETLSQMPPSEQEQSEEEADVYAGLEIYEEYQ
jgi:hypothetical protein